MFLYSEYYGLGNLKITYQKWGWFDKYLTSDWLNLHLNFQQEQSETA